MTPIRNHQGIVVKFVGVQIDVTSRTEGDQAGEESLNRVRPLIQYDDRLRRGMADPLSDEVVDFVQSKLQAGVGDRAGQWTAVPRIALDLATTVERLPNSFVIADPALPDCPVVFASDGFLRLTGYARGEILGRNCRFLQGPGTDLAELAALKSALSQGCEHTCRLLNYRKNGTAFWNLLTVAAMRDSYGYPRFLIGVQADVTGEQDEGSVSHSKDLGHAAALHISAAVAGMGWQAPVDAWASFPTGLRRLGPHMASRPEILKAAQALERRCRVGNDNDGQAGLRLGLFKRERTLGRGGVGEVYLVTLAGAPEHRFAIKSLSKAEMIRRNKVGTVIT